MKLFLRNCLLMPFAIMAVSMFFSCSTDETENRSTEKNESLNASKLIVEPDLILSVDGTTPRNFYISPSITDNSTNNVVGIFSTNQTGSTDRYKEFERLNNFQTRLKPATLVTYTIDYAGSKLKCRNILKATFDYNINSTANFGVAKVKFDVASRTFIILQQGKNVRLELGTIGCGGLTN